MKKALLTLFSLCLLTACASKQTSLYQDLGGNNTIERISNHFIEEIGGDPNIVPYFRNTNIDRFHEKFVEHLCMLTQGPCKYTGDSMQQVHTGMNINEADFNQLVDLLIKAMNKSKVPHKLQNRVLAKLAPMRSDIIHR